MVKDRDIIDNLDLIILKMMWPALILAASRKDKVRGRIRFLVSSTMARKGEISKGEFEGICEYIVFDGVIRSIRRINDNHILIPILNVTVKWEVVGGVKGVNPKIFKVHRMKNDEWRTNMADGENLVFEDEDRENLNIESEYLGNHIDEGCMRRGWLNKIGGRNINIKM